METAAKVGIQEYLNYEAPEGYRDELIEGEIVLSPEPKPRHEDICLNLLFLLKPTLSGTGYIVRTRTSAVLRADASMPSPDVLVIDADRWVKAGDTETYPEGSPQLPIEVHSPANRPGLLRRKVELYLKNGAWAVWIVYPKTRTIVVHEPADVIAEYRCGEEIPLPGALCGIRLQVEDIFQPVRP